MSLKFVFDPPGEQAIHHLYQALLNEADGRRVFALLDTIQCWPRPIIEGHDLPQANLYKGRYTGEGLEQVDPLLIECGLDQDVIRSLIDRCAGMPMLSFLVCDRSLNELLTHLRQQIEAVDPQRVSYLLRWSDTRCLPTLIRELDEDQQMRVLAGIRSWFFHDRSGAVQRIAGYPSATVTTSLPLCLSEQQFQSMKSSAEADRLLGYLESKLGAENLKGLSSERYQVAASVLSRADGNLPDAQLLRQIEAALIEQGLAS